MKYLYLVTVLFISTYATAQDELDSVIDGWHVSAAQADFDSYFNLMDSNFVFLGTAPNERWSKLEFAAFSKPYFDEGKAWNFIPSNRIWNFSSDGLIAWFDEDLDTWMEGCRGTGIMIFYNNEWKLVYYNLHVLIENEKVKEFISLRKLETKKEG